MNMILLWYEQAESMKQWSSCMCCHIRVSAEHIKGLWEVCLSKQEQIASRHAESTQAIYLGLLSQFGSPNKCP